MKRNRHTEEQIISILKANERGVSIAELARQNGVTEQTLYRWKAKYSGMEVSESKRLRELEAENARLKKLLAESALDNAALKEIVSGKWWRPKRSGGRYSIWWRAAGSASEAPADCWAWHGQWLGIRPYRVTMRRFGHACKPWRRAIPAMATYCCMPCCVRRGW
ncbi:transposase [Modicisalibacter xianhensis]|uniref:Transposase n=1 Tax=Modicisalibacter xianhensis TaxID=442341 RepID=A0A4R8G233_9GAMM|nr:transposase [Halomonas xianhensis]